MSYAVVTLPFAELLTLARRSEVLYWRLDGRDDPVPARLSCVVLGAREYAVRVTPLVPCEVSVELTRQRYEGEACGRLVDRVFQEGE